jgi:hypothetical protein
MMGVVKDIGMASIQQALCMGCSQSFPIHSSHKITTSARNQRFDINVRSVWGQMSSGGGAAKLNETAATIGMHWHRRKHLQCD